ncbi:helix-turn-helix transcriptional regulator [Maricaulis sp. CAU 1757]
MQNENLHIQPISELAATIGSRLESYRIARSIRQADLAREAGISRSTLHRIESGKGGTLENLLRVLRALGLDNRMADLIPDASLSPLDPRSADAAPRKRVSRPRKSGIEDSGSWSWDQ